MSSASAPACANWRKVVLSLNLIRCHNHLPSFRYELKQAICTKGELVMSYSGSRSSVRMNEIRRWRWATSRNENIREIFVFLLSPLLSPVHSFVLFSLFFLPLQHSDYTENKKISDKVSFSSLKHTHTPHIRTHTHVRLFAAMNEVELTYKFTGDLRYWPWNGASDKKIWSWVYSIFSGTSFLDSSVLAFPAIFFLLLIQSICLPFAFLVAHMSVNGSAWTHLEEAWKIVHEIGQQDVWTPKCCCRLGVTSQLPYNMRMWTRVPFSLHSCLARTL